MYITLNSAFKNDSVRQVVCVNHCVIYFTLPYFPVVLEGIPID